MSDNSQREFFFFKEGIETFYFITTRLDLELIYSFAFAILSYMFL